MTRMYTFKAGSFAPTDPQWSEIVAAAYEAQERPVCECGGDRPGMAIARFNGDYYLRRLPGTGLAHDPQCPSFEPPIELSGLGELRGSALLPQDDGTVDLKLGFSLSVGSGRKGPTPGEKKDPITAKAARAKLSLRALRCTARQRVSRLCAPQHIDLLRPSRDRTKATASSARSAAYLAEFLSARVLFLHDLFLPMRRS